MQASRTGIGLVLAVAGTLLIAAALPASAPLASGDWPQYRHDPQGTWSNPGSFTAADVAALQQLWSLDLGAAVYAEPIVANGIVYVTTAWHSGKVIALDAATGTQRWSRTFTATLTTTGCGTFTPGIWDAPAVVDGVLYIGAPDGKVYALDALTGATRWSAQVAQIAPHGEFLASSPSVSTALGKLYIGTSAITDCDLPPGHIASVDLATGAVQLHDVLAPKHLGGSVWSSIAIDEAADVIYATTGNPQHQPSQDPYAQAVIKLDAHTLQTLDHWQDPTYTSFEDSDFGASPTLFAAADGTPLVAAPNKDGWLYVWRRANLAAGPLWKVSLAVNGGPDNGRGSIVAPTFANGLLYAAGGATPSGKSGSVVAFEPGTGAVKWTHTPAGYVLPGMPAVGGVLIVGVTAKGNASHALEILDAETGALLRSFPGTQALWAAPVAAEGRIYTVSTAGHLVALGIRGQGGPPDGGGAHDAGNLDDGGAPDGGAPDAGSLDDGGTPDGGAPDAGTPDDGGMPDAGTPDGGTTSPTVLFQDSFSYRGPLGAGWKVVSGNFTVDGAHAQPSAAKSYALATAEAPPAAIASATVGVLAGSNYNGVLLRADKASPAGNHYAAYLNSDGSIWLARRNAFTYSYLGHSASKVNGAVPHLLELQAQPATGGVQLDVRVDGKPSLSVLDTSAQQLGPGLAGMFSYQGPGAAFDDFQLAAP